MKEFFYSWAWPIVSLTFLILLFYRYNQKRSKFKLKQETTEILDQIDNLNRNGDVYINGRRVVGHRVDYDNEQITLLFTTGQGTLTCSLSALKHHWDKSSYIDMPGRELFKEFQEPLRNILIRASDIGISTFIIRGHEYNYDLKQKFFIYNYGPFGQYDAIGLALMFKYKDEYLEFIEKLTYVCNIWDLSNNQSQITVDTPIGTTLYPKFDSAQRCYYACCNDEVDKLYGRCTLVRHLSETEQLLSLTTKPKRVPTLVLQNSTGKKFKAHPRDYWWSEKPL